MLHFLESFEMLPLKSILMWLIVVFLITLYRGVITEIILAGMFLTAFVSYKIFNNKADQEEAFAAALVFLIILAVIAGVLYNFMK